jgi:DNA-binding beta-propeller fold protein YncE
MLRLLDLTTNKMFRRRSRKQRHKQKQKMQQTQKTTTKPRIKNRNLLSNIFFHEEKSAIEFGQKLFKHHINKHELEKGIVMTEVMKIKKSSSPKIVSIIIVLLCSLFLASNVIPAYAQTYTFATKWGSLGSGVGQFDHPEGIAIDSSGNIYVADNRNDRIQKFDGNGNPIKTWGTPGTGDGQFAGPSGIAVDSNGYVYVTDSGTSPEKGRVQKFDSEGNFIKTWGYFETVGGIATDNFGNIYVVETVFNNRIQKFDSNGNFIKTWGSEGSGNGQFDGAWGIATDSVGNVYVIETGNDRIQKFDSNGNFIKTWGSHGTGDGQFQQAYGIAIDDSNNVYVADSSLESIQKFDSNGNFILKWGTPGTGDGQFDGAWGIALDSFGSVYVSEWFNNRVQKFTETPPTPQQATLQLIDNVKAMNLQQGISNSLISKLQNALASINAPNIDVRNDAANKLQAFIHSVEAQNGKKLSTIQANFLITEAQKIIDQLNS